MKGRERESSNGSGYSSRAHEPTSVHDRLHSPSGEGWIRLLRRRYRALEHRLMQMMPARHPVAGSSYPRAAGKTY